jgi:hypothetical protein
MDRLPEEPRLGSTPRRSTLEQAAKRNRQIVNPLGFASDLVCQNDSAVHPPTGCQRPQGRRVHRRAELNPLRG